MLKTHFENPFRANLFLKRYPESNDGSLQAWDAADELLLRHLSGMDLSQKRILILNDAFGALTCALESFKPTSYSDSYLSHQAIRQNGAPGALLLSDLGKLEGNYDLVLIKIPKNNSFLEDILCRITPHLQRESRLIAACRLKHLPKSSFELINRITGKTTTSLAEKKSRLIFADYERSVVTSSFPMQVKMENFAHPFLNHSNLFSHDKLDIGTRFFLANLPRGDFKRILDLGCANGIVGITAKGLNPEAELYFSDESAQAIASAKINYQRFCKAEGHFFWTNCFEQKQKNLLDLVLCNPPFHQAGTLESTTAEQMFRDAYVSLAPGGCIRVVGNSHLEYARNLKQVFQNSRTVATHPKFVVWEAIKQ